MAQQFLARILTMDNAVKSEDGQDCIICQEKCGTLSQETRTIELEVRLPCNHTVGSACIKTWLSANNTCPLCRQEFFPSRWSASIAPGRTPFLDLPWSHRRVRQGESDRDYANRVSRRSEPSEHLFSLAFLHSRQLRLYPQAALLALHIAETTFRDLPVPISVTAASMYIVCHLFHQPRSLSEVARLTKISETTLQYAYRVIYSCRYELVDDVWLSHVGSSGVTTLGEAAEALSSLPWPQLHREGIEGDEQRIQEERHRKAATLSINRRGRQLCVLFDADEPTDFIHEQNRTWTCMAQEIVMKIGDMAHDFKTRNPWTIAAACTYMASYLVFKDKTLAEISALSGIPAALIRTTYQAMYDVREQIVEEEWFEGLAWTRRAIYCLPEP